MGPVAEIPTRRASSIERDRRPAAHRHTAHRHDPGRATLDDRITALWTELVETGTGNCPVCGDEIAAARPCGACGSQLS